MTADIVLLNGNVLPMDETVAAGKPTAIAIAANRILAVGRDEDVRGLVGPATRIIDLAGRTVLPGLNDNHTHPMSYGESLGQIDASASACPTLHDLQRAYAAAGSSNPGTAWLLGRGYDDTRLDVQRHPTRWDLDEVSGDRPALLVRTCGHIAVANSAALRLAGLDRGTADPPGGAIEHNADGEPTGVLRERAMTLVTEHIPKPTEDDIKGFLRTAGARFTRYGITSVGEASIRTSTEFAAYESLARAGELPMRTFTMMLIDDTLDALASVGMATGFGDAWLRIGPAKVFQDGSGGGRTAAMSTDYWNDLGNRGITIYDQPELDDRFLRAHAAGFQLSAHAIGDRAIDMILTAYERAHASSPRPNTRPRIEHCGLCTPAILDRMVKIGVVAIPQPAFGYYLGDSYIRNFSPEQLSLAYPARDWIDRGIIAAGSSDVPVVPCDPWINIRAAVTRGTHDGQEMGPEQRVTIDEALRMFTINGAFCSFEEHLKGSLTPGKLADLVVVDRDPRAMDPQDLASMQTCLTMVDGVIAYEA